MIKWRAKAALSIRKVLADHPYAKGSTLMNFLRAAYPFGKKEGPFYKMWRYELRYQLGIEQRPKRKEQHCGR